MASSDAPAYAPASPPSPTPTSTPPGPPGAPPGYAATQPQILVLPLPDAPGFFWGRTLQGEVFVKGLGEARTTSVESLTVTARLTDRLPGRPDIEPVALPPHTLYTHDSPAAASSHAVDHPFPASHRFVIRLPTGLPDGSVLPASLDIGAAGSLRWTLNVRLALLSGEVLTETVNVEGPPPELDVGVDIDQSSEPSESSEAVLERDGARVRLVLASARPRFGEPIRIGVEVRPKKPERVSLAGFVAQPDPDESLRPLRRVRVELVRLVDTAPPDTPESTSASHTYTSVVHASGKGLRYPGQHQPPLRVLFTLSTSPLHPGPLAPGGEITARTPYHSVRFRVRATLGFGDASGPAAGTGSADWCVDKEVTIRPPVWHEPHTAVMERGMLPVPGHVDPSAADNGDEDAREAYRRKGRDVVGASGTTRVDRGDLPPPFTAGPSGTTDGTDSATETSEGTTDGALPSFTESEAEMRSGRAPLLSLAVPSQVLQPVAYEENPTPAPVPGELSTWVEYDGYERFSAPPPPAAASFGVASSMDPPREGDEDGDVVGSIVARLGLPSGSAPNPAELMEQLGLGLGTRVVDLVDDLPPGIDEPSLPALPGFAHPSPPATQHQLHPRQIPADHEHPPSFDASEAAEAVGGVARSRVGSMGSPALANLEDSDAPPGYFGGGPPAYS